MSLLARTWVLWWLMMVAAGASAQTTAWPTRQWEVPVPETQGMHSGALASLVDFGAYQQMDSLLVTRHGRIVLDVHYAPFPAGSRHAINSVTKAVIGTLAGIAIGKGVLPSAELPVGKDPVTLQHLLDMTSGLDWTEPLTDAVPQTMIEMGRSPHWTQFVLSRPVAQPPGTAFNYNSGNSHLASAIVARAAGMDTADFAAEHLFKPLGITDWHWRKDPQGLAIGGFGLYLLPRDMAKIGLLYLHRGRWDDQQVVPAAWVDKVFKASVPMQLAPGTDYRYADGWWTIPARKAYMAVGFNRQLILVLPELNVVAALTGRRHYSFDQLLDHIASAVKSASALPPNPEAAQALQAKVAAAAVEAADAAPLVSALAPQVSGRRWKFAPNAVGLRELQLRLDGTPAYEIVSEPAPGAAGARGVLYGLGLEGRFVRSEGPRGPVLSKALWTSQQTLALHARLLQDGQTATYLLRFDGPQLVEIDYSHSNGFKTLLKPLPD